MFARRERSSRRVRGQGMTEYIIIVAVIAVLSIAVVNSYGTQIREIFFKSGETMSKGELSGDGVDNKMKSGEVDLTLDNI